MPSAQLTSAQIDLVQSSIAKVMPIADVAAELFYDRLFEIAPEVRPLFRRDMKNQGRKLMTALAMVVGGLKNLDAMMPAIAGLAVKHVDYGVTAEHYEPVGEALIWTLEKGLGPAFTPATREAWMTAYGVLSGAMIEAAYGQRAAA